MTTAMELRDAHVRYGPLEALHGVNLPVPAGGSPTVLLGRNGSGRTTVLRALAGTVPLTSGKVLWRGTDITRLRPHDRARRGLCFVPDGPAVFASLTVAENLELASPAEDFTTALTAYPALRPLLPRRAGTLSGGEQRMLAVSRALLAGASGARVVLLDEPTQGMSPATAARTYELLAALAPTTTLVIAEQRLPPTLLSRTALPVFVHELRRGTVVFSGEAAELRYSRPRPAPTE